MTKTDLVRPLDFKHSTNPSQYAIAKEHVRILKAYDIDNSLEACIKRTQEAITNPILSSTLLFIPGSKIWMEHFNETKNLISIDDEDYGSCLITELPVYTSFTQHRFLPISEFTIHSHKMNFDTYDEFENAFTDFVRDKKNPSYSKKDHFLARNHGSRNHKVCPVCKLNMMTTRSLSCRKCSYRR